MKLFNIVVAADLNRGIGKGGDLPWRLSGDLKHFKELTTAVSAAGHRNAVIMGRKTWDSIPQGRRPLSKRLNVVISRNRELSLPDGVLQSSSLDEALRLIDDQADIEKCFVIGGGQIYEQAMRHDACGKLYLTEVFEKFGCDTFLPDFSQYFELEQAPSEIHERDPENDIEYTFKVFRKKSPSSKKV